MAQSVKRLPSKYEDLSPVPRSHVKKADGGPWPHNPWGLLTIQSNLIGELQAKKRLFLKAESIPEDDTQGCLLAST